MQELCIHQKVCSTNMMHKKNSLIFRYPGFSTEGDIDSVLLVGPIAPATYLGIPLNYKIKIKLLLRFDAKLVGYITERKLYCCIKRKLNANCY